MTPRISRAVLNISPSATESTSSLANTLKREGIDIISFAQGEPGFDTPDYISQKALAAIEEGYTRYTDVPGMPDVWEAVRRQNP